MWKCADTNTERNKLNNIICNKLQLLFLKKAKQCNFFQPDIFGVSSQVVHKLKFQALGLLVLYSKRYSPSK